MIKRYGFAFMPLPFAGAPIQLPMYDGAAGDGGGNGGGNAGDDKGNKGGKSRKSKLARLMDEDDELQDEVDELVQRRLARERRKGGNRADDTDNDEVEKLRQFKADKEREEAEGKKRYDEALEAERGKWGKKEESYKKAQERLAKELRQERVRGKLISTATKLGAVDPDDVADLLERHVDLDDDYQTVIRDPRDPKKTRINSEGDDMTLDELVQELLEKKPHLAKAADGEPAGAKGGKSKDAESAGKGTGKKGDAAKLEADYKAAKETAEKSPTPGNLTKMQQAKRAFEKAAKAA